MRVVADNGNFVMFILTADSEAANCTGDLHAAAKITF